MPLLPFLAACAIAQKTAPLPDISFDLASAQAQDDGAAIVPEVDPKRQTEVRKALAHAFARYPDRFLAGEVKTVYVVRDMADDGVGYGGVTGGDGESVIITDGDEAGVDAPWVEAVFHHETAHVLMDHHRREFSRRAWREATGRDFRYLHARDEDGGMRAIEAGEDDDTFRPELNVEGPVNAYGASCFDEDWATTAQNVVDPSPEYLDLVRRYPLVARRAALAEAFYERVAPGWKPSPLPRETPS